jgi:4-aminobutyrate aminotransferase-like enzyme
MSPRDHREKAALGPGPESRALATRLRAVECADVTYLGPDFPIFWVSGEGCHVTDADGRRYLDLSAAFGVAALGHGSTVATRAAARQAELLTHGMGDVHPPAVKVELLEALARRVPVDEPRVTLGTGGAMAAEIARKAAVLATGRASMLAFEGAYHGLTLGALEVCGHSKFTAPLGGLAGRRLPLLPFPDPTEPPPGVSCDAVAEHALERAEEALRAHPEAGAVIVEPIQGRGGVRVPPAGFLQALHELCRAHDALLAVDEIFTGWHRTGPRFACEAEGVRPDLLLLGKATAGGLPIGACVGRREVMDAFGESTVEALHTETFLGHPMTMAAGFAAIEALCASGVEEHVREMGSRVQAMLERAFEPWGHRVAAIRGAGLMWAVALVEPASGAPDAFRTSAIVRAALAEGLILLGGGLHGSTVQLTPPLCICPDEIEEAEVALVRALGRV